MPRILYPSLIGSIVADAEELRSVRRVAPATGDKEAVKDSQVVKKGILVDGQTLSIPGLVAVARYHRTPTLDASEAVKGRINGAVACLATKLQRGESLYGINTGFGGSADSRTANMHALQLALLQHQQCGILPVPRNFPACTPTPPSVSLRLSEDSLSQPEAWVRGAMVVRLNSLMRGHSGVRWSVLENMQSLLAKGITPVVPVRSSISASGDLSPLSYVAGCLAGQPGIWAWVDGPDGTRVKVPSCEALKMHGIPRTTYEPKEALGILNGTAFSAALGGLVLHDAKMLLFLTQVTTAMAVEAEQATDSSFAPFIHDEARPHPGQIECAATILSLLRGSKLASHIEDEVHVTIEEDDGHLRQSRYPLRTSAQWLGPQIEDVLTAVSTLETEMNSTTDNPLISVKEDQIHHGGNFQAMAVSNAMEKTRLALAACAKITFQQMTELINPAMNCGLPANLAATDPSLNFHAKGIDIALAAVTAEIGYLANPVTTHVQSAEMGNQAINSMALCSARYTVRAIECLSQILAWSLYLLCQAYDLRAIQLRIALKLREAVHDSIGKFFGTWINTTDQATISKRIWNSLNKRMDETSARDLHARLTDAFMSAGGELIYYFSDLPSGGGADPLRTIMAWRDHCAKETHALYREVTREFLEDAKGCHASHLLGRTNRLYVFIRRTLGVPMHGIENFHEFQGEEGAIKASIGGYVSVIHEAIVGGDLYDCLVDLARDIAPEQAQAPASRL